MHALCELRYVICTNTLNVHYVQKCFGGSQLSKVTLPLHTPKLLDCLIVNFAESSSKTKVTLKAIVIPI